MSVPGLALVVAVLGGLLFGGQAQAMLFITDEEKSMGGKVSGRVAPASGYRPPRWLRLQDRIQAQAVDTPGNSTPGILPEDAGAQTRGVQGNSRSEWKALRCNSCQTLSVFSGDFNLGIEEWMQEARFLDLSAYTDGIWFEYAVKLNGVVRWTSFFDAEGVEHRPSWLALAMTKGKMPDFLTRLESELLVGDGRDTTLPVASARPGAKGMQRTDSGRREYGFGWLVTFAVLSAMIIFFVGRHWNTQRRNTRQDW